MAKKKKSRVPAPPRSVQASERRVQAPQRRVESSGENRTRMWFLVLGGVILVAAVAAGIAWATLRGGDNVVLNGTDGACVRQTFPAQKRAPHIEFLPGRQLPEGFRYDSFPPSSGYHSAQTAIWNVYDEPVPEQNLVHNLEHGGVVVQYGSRVPEATVAKIVAWYQESPEGMIVAPLPPLDEILATPPPDAERKIFLTAWTHVATCSTFDEGAFNRFVEDFRNPNGDAPETPNFPLSALQPGNQ